MRGDITGWTAHLFGLYGRVLESWLGLRRDGDGSAPDAATAARDRTVSAAGAPYAALAAHAQGRNGPGPDTTVTLRSDDLPLGEDDPQAEPPVPVEDDAVLRLLAEELSVGRRQVETGRLQIRRTTRERIAEVDEELHRLDAEIERRPVGTFVDARPEVRETEDEIVIPVVEEVVVVERRLMLREEICIRKVRRSERHREQVRLRVQEADILRLPPRPPATGN